MNSVHEPSPYGDSETLPSQKPNWLHEPPIGPASALGHAQAVHGLAHCAHWRSVAAAPRPCCRSRSRAPAAHAAPPCHTPRAPLPPAERLRVTRPSALRPLTQRPAPARPARPAPNAHTCAPQPAQLPAMQ